MDVVAREIRFLVRGWWPLVPGEVSGWSAWLLPSHTLVLLVHGGSWPAGVGWWAVVVVRARVGSGGVCGGGAVGGGGAGGGGDDAAGMALGLLVDILVPLVGVGVGHRAQSLGLYFFGV